MEDFLDTLLFGTDPSPEKREELRDRLDQDPALADAWALWRRARAHIQERLQERLSDRRLLVMYVLEQDGAEEALTENERAALDAARDDITKALDEISALEHVVERIRAERADFEAVWATHTEPAEASADAEQAAAPTTDGRQRTDRAPRAPQSRDTASARRWTRRLAVAVLVAAMAVAAVLYWPEGAPTTTVTVAEGATRTVALGDRATARLVGKAALTHPAEGSGEFPSRVTLREGRAFFDVQRRSDDATFVVETPTATATVLGTQFGVRAVPDTTEVVLASGSVRIGPVEGTDDDGVVLEPGQKSWVTTSGTPAAPTATDLTAELEWTGLFVFRSVPLASIADRLSRHYDVQIAVADALADERITGDFEREQPVQQVLEALAATLGAEVQEEAGRYRLVPAQ